eukprot:TRINITY_DN1531_c0_g1_i1.p1 TRINITY_DN1531_c0_g1~~TRINITY_DN1531_c0_g1_i1.p1  ORF type:complete len:289 (+),score=76.01 TRINITY_DN1531_c0_g1_i1:99-965(+)
MFRQREMFHKPPVSGLQHSRVTFQVDSEKDAYEEAKAYLDAVTESYEKDHIDDAASQMEGLFEVLDITAMERALDASSSKRAPLDGKGGKAGKAGKAGGKTTEKASDMDFLKVDALVLRALVDTARKMEDSAKYYYTLSIQFIDTVIGPFSPLLPIPLMNLSLLMLGEDAPLPDVEKAHNQLSRAKRIAEDFCGSDRKTLADIYHNIGVAEEAMGLHENAAKSFYKSFHVRCLIESGLHGSSGVMAVNSLRSASFNWMEIKEGPKAAKCLEKAQKLFPPYAHQHIHIQ